MRTKTWGVLSAGAFALALVSAPAMAAGEFSAWDRDGDGRIDSTDFDRGFGTTTFDQWDIDRDGVLTRSEFNSGVYQAYDFDGDGYLDEREFGAYAGETTYPRSTYQRSDERGQVRSVHPSHRFSSDSGPRGSMSENPK